MITKTSDSDLDHLLSDLNLNLVRTNEANLFQFENCLKSELVDGRGGKNIPVFYDYFPDMESVARAYLMEQSSAKDCSFTLHNFANFFTQEYRKLYALEDAGDGFVRSTWSLHMDLNRWGFKIRETKGKLPYWVGHEREDIIEARNAFINYFLGRRDNYYVPEEAEDPKWIARIERPCILMFHDESTFRSGEQSKYRLNRIGFEQFVNKGRGRSFMISDFIVCGEEPFFSLTEEEWNAAVDEFPDLNEPSNMEYEPRTATGGLIPGGDNYMDNIAVLSQFTRLFKMLKHKKAYNYPVKHNIEIVVDNARTHTALIVNVDDFGFLIFQRIFRSNIPIYLNIFMSV